MNKLHHKDFSIAFKTGTDANKSKFKNEAVQGEMYFATDTGSFYVAETTAGAIDATLAQFAIPNLFSVALSDTEANIRASTTSVIGDTAYGTDTEDFYVFDGTNWQIFTNV
jgi:hypothetical protein